MNYFEKKKKESSAVTVQNIPCSIKGGQTVALVSVLFGWRPGSDRSTFETLSQSHGTGQ